MFGLHFTKAILTLLWVHQTRLSCLNPLQKYFGNEDPLGKTLVNRNGEHIQPFEVTGIYKDFPGNSHLILDYLVSYSTLAKELLLGR